MCRGLQPAELRSFPSPIVPAGIGFCGVPDEREEKRLLFGQREVDVVPGAIFQTPAELPNLMHVPLALLSFTIINKR
jgi:hypothetical protein